MEKIILIALLFTCAIGISQVKMIGKSGKVTFEASVPSFEEVKAVNNNVTFVLNPQTGEIASLALMKGFQFKVALMEEHFNENYIESDQYPKAVFRGKIEGFDLNSLTADFKSFVIKGKLELHGKSKDIKTTARICKSVTGITILSSFSVNADDFNIKIPSLVKNKVSNKINIQIDAAVK
ncbi:YceI family protein [Flavobacterium defluvii]|uniref:YceI-like domain-containing protein n=1 Tax=Flavobacterium defluvii TaxID=370979 RepID=A0A1M5IYB3_9FLAO|nr:YceI family protein [Flavobacterium defluvii]SHG33327.1 YceI-like domain-containing protein [Flavobacterium defluvii]